MAGSPIRLSKGFKELLQRDLLYRSEKLDPGHSILVASPAVPASSIRYSKIVN